MLFIIAHAYRVGVRAPTSSHSCPAENGDGSSAAVDPIRAEWDDRPRKLAYVLTLGTAILAPALVLGMARGDGGYDGSCPASRGLVTVTPLSPVSRIDADVCDVFSCDSSGGGRQRSSQLPGGVAFCHRAMRNHRGTFSMGRQRRLPSLSPMFQALVR